MKKSVKDFKDRYGDEYKSVMYATATKMAKEEVVDGQQHGPERQEKISQVDSKGRRVMKQKIQEAILRDLQESWEPSSKELCARMKGMKTHFF